MKRFLSVAALLAVAVSGCTTYQEERDTTQPMKVRKSAFMDDGIWYMHSTVIDSPYEAGFTFPGETGGYFGLNKIRWVIEENYLYAYRTYEFIRDSAMAESQDDFLGAPVAAYRIQRHFDVWHQYNNITGEKMPVIYEATERPWWEREWMRVDWSKNHINAFNWMFSEICKMDGSIRTNPIAYYPTHPDDPEQFYVAVRGSDEESCEREHGGVWVEDERSGAYCNIYGWDNIEQLETFDYMDVVNREFVHLNIMSAQMGCISYPHIPWDGGMQVTYRHSFMRVEPRNYKPLFMPERAFERYGYFRTEREVYDPLWGTRDFKDEFANRWNIWQAAYDDEGNVIPKRNRDLKPIIYYYVPTEKLPSQKACEQGHEGFCTQYVTDELYHESAAEWNKAFRNTLRAVNHPDADTADVVVARPVEYRCGPRGPDGEENNLPCQNLGDVRYSHIWNHDHVFDGAPGGYGPPLVDPETGEIIAGVANVYGGYWRRYDGMMREYYDLAKGDLTELEILTGENLREYFAHAQGNVLPPQMPLINLEALESHEARVQRGELRTTDENRLTMNEIERKRNLEDLRRNLGSDLDRRQPIVGTDLERKSIPMELQRFYGLQRGETLTEDVLDRISPFRHGARWHEHSEEAETFFGKRFACFRDVDKMFDNPNYPMLFNWAEEQLAAQGIPVNRTTVVDFVLQRYWVHTAVHEMGHTLGLRHQFESHFDEENFFPEYWEIQKELPNISMGTQEFNAFLSEYDLDGDGMISQEEYNLFRQDYLERRRAQLDAGMDMYRYTSIMDYLVGFHAGIQGIARWDNAAIKFGYGGTIETYSFDQGRFDADQVNESGGWDDFVFKKNNRIDVPYYLGGERCVESSECPHAEHGRVRQKCRADRGFGRELVAGTPEDLGVCTSIWFEMDEMSINATNPVYPDYMFCSDERVRDRPFCSRSGQGISAQEMVQSAIEGYEWNYIFANFRRYRGDTFQPYFYFNRLWGRVFQPIGKIHQSLLYNYYYRDGYTENVGPGGMLDTFLASRNAFNFFAKVLATPDQGSYIAWDPRDNLYEGSYSELHRGWADFFVPLGIGKYLWSAYDEGYFGQLWRYARIGTFFDKIFAIEALTTRDWGLPSANDETFPMNFYDSFQDEMLELFTSLVTGDMKRYAPIIRDVEMSYDENGDEKGLIVTEIEYRDFWQGSFFGDRTEDFRGLEAVVGEDQSWRYEGEALLDAGGSIWVRLYSLIYALFDFPVFFDSTFPSYVQLYQYGRPSAKDDEAIRQGEEDGSLVVFRSIDLDTIYVTPRMPEDKSMFVPLLERAIDQADIVVELREEVDLMENEEWEWSGFLTRNPVCGKILGLRSDTYDNNRECLLWLTSREESRLNSMESFLTMAMDYLHYLGYTR